MIYPYGLIKQIMEETGLSRNTVSCVLSSSVKYRNKPPKETIQKIAEAMNKLGYKVSELDLSVGDGISFSREALRFREYFYSSRLNISKSS
jgi:transcriptional regulator with XRE-family HTH domain